MDNQQKLDLIQNVPVKQKRLALLVEHGFNSEASQLIHDAMLQGTAFLYYDRNYVRNSTDLCKRSTRSNQNNKTFVVIHDSTKLERTRDESEICFELGWEQLQLGWTDTENLDLVKEIALHAMARPLNQWSLPFSEGIARAVKRLKSADYSLRKEVHALFLVRLLREADFGRVQTHLEPINGFAETMLDDKRRTCNYGKLIDWIVDELRACGWDESRIRKELLEWIYLHTGTWPQFLLAVARADVFREHSAERDLAVEKWLVRRFDDAIGSIYSRQNRKEINAYAELFQCGRSIKGYVAGRLVDRLALGVCAEVEYFLERLGNKVDLLSGIRGLAMPALHQACRQHRYDVALLLMKRYELADPGYDIHDKAALLRQL